MCSDSSRSVGFGVCAPANQKVERRERRAVRALGDRHGDHAVVERPVTDEDVREADRRHARAAAAEARPPDITVDEQRRSSGLRGDGGEVPGDDALALAGAADVTATARRRPVSPTCLRLARRERKGSASAGASGWGVTTAVAP